MNLRHPAPKAGTLAKLSYTSIYSVVILRLRSVLLCSPSCKIVALTTAVFIALFCCASSSSLYLLPAAVAFVTQSRHSSQTELHLDIFCCNFETSLGFALLALLQNCRTDHCRVHCSVLLRFLKLPLSAAGSGRFRHPKQAL